MSAILDQAPTGVPSNPRKRCSGSGSFGKVASSSVETTNCGVCGRHVVIRSYSAATGLARLISHKQPSPK
jgi:hypothetical protein